MKTIPIVCALALAAGCATAPPAAPPPVRTVAQADAAHAPLNGDAIRSAVAPTSDADKELAKWARTQGFRPTKIADRAMWCRSETEIGSHLPHNNCVSDDTLVEMRRVYDSNKQDMLNATLGCQGMADCGRK